MPSLKGRGLEVTGAIVVLLGLAFFVIVGANAFRELPQGKAFLTQFPGQSELPVGAPVGFPAWLQWQHFLNSFFILFIVRTGWQVRTTKRPEAYWTRNNKGIIKTKNPPVRISLPLWLHLSIDSLWVLNGVVFLVLIFATGQWVRIVPTSWDVIPNAVSAAIQYASMNWPTEDGWVNYNALQLLAYFVTVFIAGPLAFITGIRMVPGLSGFWKNKDKIYPIKIARAIHFPVMIYFVLFVFVHVVLVFATGALRNLNHMYWGTDEVSWWGAGVFAISLVIMAVAWVLARPIFLVQLAGLTGRVGR